MSPTHTASEDKPSHGTEHPKFGYLPLGTSGPQDCALSGSALLNTPHLNKGSAFPADERREFNLTGLLPEHIATLEEQVKRAYQQYQSRHDDLAKNTFMTSLKEQNEVLFYRVRDFQIAHQLI
jgi:malate dehydrogenase (oxaloacetate-decarboxylating)